MLDFRIKKPQSAVNWRYQEIVVSQSYIDGHPDLNLVELDYEYDVGKKVLDVYFNGQRLTEGGGYEEVDTLHIRLDIRDPEGNPAKLEIGDEIVIKEWFNTDSVIYGVRGLTTRLTNLEIEVKDARKDFPKLVDKITDMDREIANLLGEGNYQISYTYDPNTEDIVRETVTGDYELVREMEYNYLGKPLKEVITHGKLKTTRQYIYDPVTYRVVQVVSNTVTI
ncbi:hypothetical protein IAQ67_29115 (plasmid) [Paenibacillus peoriae]|uniref:Uncharacterized protein n=1 Tax=Paenibacillus peoriae TaxID=59893 RepID=A0A7H0YH57_9BACL|nr:hypothetical protein [Paenibacillus peoriae]QNR70415.1 hypothetical protein IAQ67_29115 [Paenibacillus peoriae]